MTRSEIITQLKQFFKVDNLVCNHTFASFGERSWQFLSTPYLHCLLVIRRDILQTPMFCNNYNVPGGPFRQRGLRCNLCDLVKSKSDAGKLYLSAHVMGSAGDFDSKGLAAVQARHKIEDNAAMLPYPIRLESNVTWLHFDTYDSDNGQKVTYFNA